MSEPYTTLEDAVRAIGRSRRLPGPPYEEVILSALDFDRLWATARSALSGETAGPRSAGTPPETPTAELPPFDHSKVRWPHPLQAKGLGVLAVRGGNYPVVDIAKTLFEHLAAEVVLVRASDVERILAERSDATPTPVVHSGSSSGDGERRDADEGLPTPEDVRGILKGYERAPCCRDAERLDWLEANTYMASHGAVGLAARDQWWVVGCPARDVRWKGSTLRAAIDAAMAAAPVPPISEAGTTGGRDAGRGWKEALDAGEVVEALCHMPFGYTSRLVGGGYLFRVDSGPLRGQSATAPTLLDAVRLAVSQGTTEGGTP